MAREKDPGACRGVQAQLEAISAELAASNAKLRAEMAARDAAEEQLRLSIWGRDEFLATLAHELRNPLAPIRYSLDLLGATDADEAERQWGRQVISRQVQQMTRRLDELMDVSRLRRGRLVLKMEPDDLTSLIDAAVETATPLIESKNLRLTVARPQMPVSLAVDSVRMSQALAHLLTNAAKYSNPGGNIVLRVDLVSSALSMTVKDNGIGFEMTAIAGMFDPFTPVASPGPRREGGLGIGLALAKGLVALHGGTVNATSAGRDRGAEFTIRLPTSLIVTPEVPGAPNVPTIEVPDRERCKVLIIDDNRDSADALALLLRCDGFEVAVGYSGQEALELGYQQRADALILDIGLPDILGYEVARRIRLEPWGRDLLLMAMTGWGQPADKERAFAAGFDRHLVKPIDPEEVLRCLIEFIAARKSKVKDTIGSLGNTARVNSESES